MHWKGSVMRLLVDLLWIVLSMILFSAGITFIVVSMIASMNGDKVGGAIGVVMGLFAMGLAMGFLDKRDML